MAKEYFPRILDRLLNVYLEAFGAVLIKGPKWCGKTTTALQKAKSVLRLQDSDQSNSYLQMAQFMPSRLLEGDVPRLIDEWQMAPILWDAVRNAVDQRGMSGQFILTGSTVVDESKIMHSGTGRIAQIDMNPMSLYESKESTGEVSLTSLFEDQKFEGATSKLTVEELVFAICRGGWPASLGKTERTALLIPLAYVDALCSSDVSRMDGSAKDPARVRGLLQAYARNLSTLASNRTILRDVIENDTVMNEASLYRYMAALTRLYVLKDVPAWNPEIRSATSQRSTNKKGMIDPSLAVAALSLTPTALLSDLNTLGFCFESLCIRDLRIYSAEMGGEISYYRDRYGLECDVVLHLRDGNYALIEAKLGSKEIEESAGHLTNLKGLIQKNKLKQPKFLMILTAGQFAYRREDSVYVVPLACLKP
jgi:predicted AAA+ superfamily ATPase